MTRSRRTTARPRWLIAGAGAAGLSLAVHLRRAKIDAELVLVEPRAHYEDDRSWCGFRTEAHPFAGCVTHRWDRWEVRHGERVHSGRSAAHPYEYIPAARFYEAALDELHDDPQVTLRLGESVTALVERGDEVVATIGASDERYDHAFDARPLPLISDDELHFVQHFGGRVVRTARPRFNPGCATLMDFVPIPASAPPASVHFRYVLPFDEHTALIEDTWFTPAAHFDAPLDALYESELEPALGKLGDHEVIRTERGALPMFVDLVPDQRARITPIGLRGGAAKPATGYAFSFIQRHAAALTRFAAQPIPDWTRAPRPRSRYRRWSDEIFLRRLRRHPEDAPALFLHLFESTPSDQIARFLSEASTPAEDLRLMAAMPTVAMSAEAFRSVAERGRALLPALSRPR